MTTANSAPRPTRGRATPDPSSPAQGTGPGRAKRWASPADYHHEPFRLFFPFATLAGLIGVALWPVMSLGWSENYPGPSHARLMVQGFFGGFIFGFLGTAMPRLVEARPLSARETLSLLALFLVNVAANVVGLNALADACFVGELVLWFTMLKRRCHGGLDQPPPSFVLVGLAFASALAGTALGLAGRYRELDEASALLARLLSYHAFVLLTVLGAGGFVLPRFLGLGSRQRVPGSGPAPTGRRRTAGVAKGSGVVILGSYALEAAGWSRVAAIARTAAVVAYLCHEMPVERLRWHRRGVQWQLVTGLICVPSGIFAAGWFSAMRLTWSHLELVGGFALITIGVATKVVSGHSGGREQIERFNPGLTVGALLMLLGLAARISGDYLPGGQANHYAYGAVCWIGGALLWATCVLPRVRWADPEV